MNFKKLFFSSAIVIGASMASLAAQAQEAPTIGIYGLGNYPFYKIGSTAGNVNASVKGSLGYGGGVLINSILGSSGVGLEAGAAYEVTRYTGKATFFNATLQHNLKDYQAIDIPFGVRLKADPVSVFLGGYYDIALNNSGDNVFGPTVGVGFHAGVVFIEPRLKYNLKKDSQDKNSLMAEVLVGYMFGGTK